MQNFLCPDFLLNSQAPFGQLLIQEGVMSFHEALNFALKLPYKRISDLDNLALVVLEKRGTCSSKHGFLAAVAQENNHPEIRLEMGYFRCKFEKIPALKRSFENFPIDHIVEAHVYLKYKSHIIDVTSSAFDAQLLLSPSDLIESQPLLPHEAGSIKQLLHQNYFKMWCNQNKIDFTRAWDLRGQIISFLVEKTTKRIS